MIIQATPYGTKKEEPFAFTYSGDFTDERVDGIGDVTLNTSGQLVTSGKAVTVSVYILGAGGGAIKRYNQVGATGGGGGNQTVEVTLEPGTYEIVIGSGGAARDVTTGYAGNGGDTTAFGVTSTGGKGGYTTESSGTGGAGGTPNGGAGAKHGNVSRTSGGSPNGGGIVNYAVQPGGNGLVRITFS